jgi:hypothetical protein
MLIPRHFFPCIGQPRPWRPQRPFEMSGEPMVANEGFMGSHWPVHLSTEGGRSTGCYRHIKGHILGTTDDIAKFDAAKKNELIYT